MLCAFFIVYHSTLSLYHCTNELSVLDSVDEEQFRKRVVTHMLIIVTVSVGGKTKKKIGMFLLLS